MSNNSGTGNTEQSSNILIATFAPAWRCATMLKTRCLSLMALVVVCASAFAQTSAPCAYTFFNPGNYSDQEEQRATSINRWHNVVGITASGPFIRYSDGRIKSLNIRTPTMAFPFRRNAFATTVGEWIQNGFHGFIDTAGVTQLFDFPGVTGQTNSHPRGLNRYGTVVGWTDGTGAAAWMLKGGKFTKIIAGTRVLFPKAISDTGVIAGDYYDSASDTTLKSFVLANGQFQQIVPPRGKSISITSINASGTLVGIISPSTNGGFAPFAYKNGVFYELQVPGGVHNAYAWDVNGYDEIVGDTQTTFTSSDPSFIAKCAL